MLKEKSARFVVMIAEKTALHMSTKASFWTHYQPREPESIRSNKIKTIMHDLDRK